jgi:hypothetical protein
MNNHHPKEEVLGPEFIFHQVKNVEINWSNSLGFEPKLYDCSFDEAESGFNIGVICLKNKNFADDKSLIFYNNTSNTENSIYGDYDNSYFAYPGFDQMFTLNPNKIDEKYDEIVFYIFRPQTRNNKDKNWIDHDLVKEVKDKICYVNCEIRCGREYIKIKNIKYEYNKFGAIVLFRFSKIKDVWNLNLKHDIFNNGLIEIIELHLKTFH